jgi:hypothetical protein
MWVLLHFICILIGLSGNEPDIAVEHISFNLNSRTKQRRHPHRFKHLGIEVWHDSPLRRGLLVSVGATSPSHTDDYGMEEFNFLPSIVELTTGYEADNYQITQLKPSAFSGDTASSAAPALAHVK